MIVIEMTILKVIMKNYMETKQTAIQWLIDNLHYMYSTKWEDKIEQAKQMEKEQIMDAYESATLELANERNDYLSEQYYTETYGKEKS